MKSNYHHFQKEIKWLADVSLTPARREDLELFLQTKLQKQSEFIELLAARGKTENIRDYMVKNIKSY